MCYQGLKACVNKCPAALICWAPIVLGCRPQWQLHQATSCCKSAHVSGAWFMSATGLYIFSRSFDLNILMLENLLMFRVQELMTALRLFWSSYGVITASANNLDNRLNGEKFRISTFNFWKIVQTKSNHDLRVLTEYTFLGDPVHLLIQASGEGWWHLRVSTGGGGFEISTGEGGSRCGARVFQQH